MSMEHINIDVVTATEMFSQNYKSRGILTATIG